MFTVLQMYLKIVYNDKCVYLFSLIQYTLDRILEKRDGLGGGIRN